MALYDHLQAMKWIFVQWAKSLAPRAIVEMLGLGMNLTEEAADFVRTQINIVDAEGLTLEKLGAKFGVARGGMTDEIYRAAIIVEARSLFASGDSAAILGMMLTLLPDAVLHETEFYPHTFVIFVQNAELDMLNVLGQLLEDVPSLTINGNLAWVDEEVLTFGSVEGSVAIPADIAGCWGSVEGPVDGDAGFATAIPI